MNEPKTPIRVLEIGDYAAGYAGKLFAHAGFEVVRIEPKERKACWVSDRAMDLFLNFDKKRLCTEDPTLIGELAEKANIVVLDAESTDEVEALGFQTWGTPIKVAVTPFGLTGPDRNRPATNATLLALGGYTNLMGDADREPLSLPGHYIDFQSGGYAYTAAMSCFLGDSSDTIDIGMLEVIMSLSQFTTVMWTCSGIVRSRHGNDFWWVVPTSLFRCRDGWVYINIVPQFWDPFTAFLEKPELAIDDRFLTNRLRMEHRDELHAIIEKCFIQWTRSDIQTRAEIARIPIGALLTFDEVLADEHLTARSMWQSIRDHTGEKVQSPRLPFKIPDLEQSELTLGEVEEPTNG